ncbi:RuBisCO large subunit C-terminal-like domain-containing protein [Immundisolibacter sp.]|uniref:RuBisCO large subunit C-terminal-like domain-containing protein n=1 Tax=Immundisolibacter sp. TaxID=1934948 RepID=UPI0026218480|nr:RuBisCO large subunit C-terminal-like domain-containing protein [Immundisolibacter sp.]MDD3651082.1 RuBisCO large subunit C-terminal-like domain-containing protein [Immundisolibacter sp.]
MSAIPSRRVDSAARSRPQADPGSAHAATTAADLRGDGRLGVRYALTLAVGEDAARKAALIGLEQTVELPQALLDPALAERMAGRVETVRQTGPRRAQVDISYSLQAIGDDLPQCLNLLFGNISLKPGIRIVGIDWPAALVAGLGGPGHGIAGLRELTGVHGRALLCTALKPMGLSAADLARLGAAFARGGIDIIKDDHGLADQPAAPFAERLARCQEAVASANAAAGTRALYFPNVTAPAAQLPRRLEAAKAAGCRGVLISPWLVGIDTLRLIRDQYGLATLAHPALTGSLFGRTAGMAPELVLGDLFRLAGADAVIYPNAGGRFDFSAATCARINRHLRRPLGALRASLPAPAGGMNVASAGHWARRYGPDTLLLIGGSLYAQGDLVAAAAALRRAVEAAS